MRKRVRNSFDLRFLTLWITAGVCEFPVLALMAGFALPVAGHVGFVLHCAAAVLVFFAPPPGKGYFQPTRHWGEALGLITLLVPGIGWAAAGWLVLGNAQAPLDKEAYRFGDASEEDSNPPAARVSPRLSAEFIDAHNTIPAVDALLGGSPALKRGAIETLAKIQTPDAVGWILKARADADPELRFYATTALTRLKHDFETLIHAAEREVFQTPADQNRQIALQRVRYEFAVSGLLEAEARATLLQECSERLGPLARKHRDAARVLYLVEKHLAPERAFATLDRLEEFDPQARGRWVRERAELLFSLGRIDELRSLLRARRPEMEEGGGTATADREWRSAFLWWTDD